MEDVRISEFNELQFKMLRVHKLQDQINELSINPLSQNLSFGDYNYNLIISILGSLYSEVNSKCTEKEIEEATLKFENLDKLIDSTPPYEKGNHPTSRRLIINKDNWRSIKKELKELNLYIRKLLDNHGFNPDKEGDGGWD